MYLFRVGVKPTDVFSRYYNKKLKPFYVVQADKQSAINYVSSHLKSGLSITNVAKLGDQLATYMYHSE